METTNPQAEAPANPQAEVSMEDRILNAMGEGEPEDQATEEVPEDSVEDSEEQPEEEQPEGLIEVEVDGEVWQVPPGLKAKIDMANDYTRKTQEVAAERKTVEEQRNLVEQERQAFQNQVYAQQQNFQIHAQLAAIDQQIAQFQQVNWEQLVDSDPVEAMKLDRNFRGLKDARNELVQQAIAHQTQLQQMQQVEFAQLLQRGMEELPKRIPGWGEEKRTEILNYGLNTGFSKDELNSIIDPRHVEVLHKAMQFDKLMASKPGIKNKVAVAGKVIKAGAAQPKQSGKDVLRKVIKSSTSRESKHAAIQQYLAKHL